VLEFPDEGILSLYSFQISSKLSPERFFRLVANVDAMKSSGFKSSNLSNDMNLINSINHDKRTIPLFFIACVSGSLIFLRYGQR
jgi:hypothetical protein